MFQKHPTGTHRFVSEFLVGVAGAHVAHKRLQLGLHGGRLHEDVAVLDDQVDGTCVGGEVNDAFIPLHHFKGIRHVHFLVFTRTHFTCLLQVEFLLADIKFL